jgi:Retrotransposon gag protein/Zinc knuckle
VSTQRATSTPEENIFDQNYFKFTINEAYKSLTRNKPSEENPQPSAQTDTAPTQEINMPATAPKVALPAVEPGCFYGKAGENVKNYIENFEAAATANRWTEAVRKQYLPFYLRDTARKWYNGCKDTAELGTWEELKELFKAAFDNADFQEMLEIKLINRKRVGGERLEGYIYDVLDLCRQIDPDMPQRLKIRHIRRGLNSELYDSLAAASQTDLNEFLRAVKGAEALRVLKETKKDTAQAENQPAAASVTVNNIQQVPATASDASSPDTLALINALASKVDQIEMNHRKPAQQNDRGGRPMSIAQQVQQAVRQEMQNIMSQQWSQSGRGGYAGGRGGNRGGRAQWQSGRNAGGIKCFNCNRVGHIARVCRSQSNRGGDNNNQRGN